MTRETRRDLGVGPLALLDWHGDAARASLIAVAEHATQCANDAVGWYRAARVWKRRWAQLLRVLSITAAATAGVWPMLAQIDWPSEGGAARAFREPVVSSILIACAVFFVALDKFFGFSSGWVRYMLADQQIEAARLGFEVDFQQQLARMREVALEPPAVERSLALIRAFQLRVAKVVGDETGAWALEFQSTLRQQEIVLEPRGGREAESALSSTAVHSSPKTGDTEKTSAATWIGAPAGGG